MNKKSSITTSVVIFIICSVLIIFGSLMIKNYIFGASVEDGVVYSVEYGERSDMIGVRYDFSGKEMIGYFSDISDVEYSVGDECRVVVSSSGEVLGSFIPCAISLLFVFGVCGSVIGFVVLYEAFEKFDDEEHELLIRECPY